MIGSERVRVNEPRCSTLFFLYTSTGAGYNLTRNAQPRALSRTGAERSNLAVLPIIEYPHPVLRRRAKRVLRIDGRIQRLADDMTETLRSADGVGLAANQVGVLKRVIVIQLPEEDDARVYVNPKIVHREGHRDVEEGCLSIPGYKATVPRSLWVRANGLDRRARVFRLHADGLLAQALEHEIDHLNGILYIDHLKSHQRLVELEPEHEHAEAVVG